MRYITKLYCSFTNTLKIYKSLPQIHSLRLQAWRYAPEDSGQVQLPYTPEGYCILCKARVHLNWPHTVLHLNRTHITKKSYQFDMTFFIHCESNGISSPLGVYHHRRCISSAVGCILFRNDDILAKSEIYSRFCA